MAFEGPQGSAGNTNSDQSAEKNLSPKGAIRGIQPKTDLKFRVLGIWMEFEGIFPDGYIIHIDFPRWLHHIEVYSYFGGRSMQIYATFEGFPL